MTVQVPVLENEVDHWPSVVIVGSGFGGLRAARALMKHKVRVTLVDRNNYHLFQPLLYQVATAGISSDGIAYPVRAIFRGHRNATFRMADVTGVDYEKKLLLTNTVNIPYDYLLLAFGSETNFFGLQSVQKNGLDMKGILDATRIRNHVLEMFERAVQEPDPEKRKAMLTFVVVGGGPTGVESAGALSELIGLVLRREYPGLNFDDVRIILLEAASRLLSAMPPDLSQAAEEILSKKHVDVRFNAQVTGYDGQMVSLKDETVLPTRTLIWAAGVQAGRLAGHLDVEQARGGRVKVDPALRLPGHPDVFVIGDAAYLEDGQGKPLPMVAPVAMQQADAAVVNILRAIDGKAPENFRYQDPGTLATIGRNQAVASIGRWKFKGVLAWWVWLGVHLIQLIGFRNRLVVLIGWIWDYILFDRAVRLITAE